MSAFGGGIVNAVKAMFKGSAPSPKSAPTAASALSRFDISLAFTLKSEGGFVNDPLDPGGATYKGVTLATYREWADLPDATPEDLKNLPDATIAELYKQAYWISSRSMDLPHGVDLSVFDMAVNAGVGRSVKLLQQAVGATQDGALGPATMKLVAAFDPATLCRRLYTVQLAFYHGLASFQTFGRGWTRRCQERLDAALA